MRRDETIGQCITCGISMDDAAGTLRECDRCYKHTTDQERQFPAISERYVNALGRCAELEKQLLIEIERAESFADQISALQAENARLREALEQHKSSFRVCDRCENEMSCGDDDVCLALLPLSHEDQMRENSGDQ